MSQRARPNLLVIMTDQHDPRVAGFGGDPVVRTQHLDALARRGVQFDSAVSPSPVCTRARMCMMTGKEVHRCAAWNNHWIIFPEHKTWPAHFSDHGYRTCLVGKMHFGGRDQMQGFQHRPYGDLKHGLGHQPDPIDLFPGYAEAKGAGITELPESLLQDVVVTRETLAFLLEHQDTEPDRPWFVCASYSRPHPPYTAPGRYIRRYQGQTPRPYVASDDPDGLEPYARKYVRANLTPEETQRGREGYYACVDFVDDCIGDLLDGLGAAGLLDNTIVIYTSDHGEMAGHRGIWGKVVYFEPSTAIPLLISGPGIAPEHHRLAQPISLMDLYPTTCGLAGLPVPAGLDGVDFSKVLADPANAARPREFAPSAYYSYGVRVKSQKKPPDEHAPHGAMRLVRDARWKYVEIEQGMALLFDVVNDPHETVNLADRPEHQERCQRMRAALHRDFSWEAIHAQLAADRARLPQYYSGVKPSTPNQYVLPDGRMFDAEGDLYGARWLYLPGEATAGIIPQQYG